MHSKTEEECYAWSSRVKFKHTIFFVGLDSVLLKSSPDVALALAKQAARALEICRPCFARSCAATRRP